MDGNVKAWPKVAGTPAVLPDAIFRPCDAGLQLATMNLETELGTIEAYNRLVRMARKLKHQIDRGEAKPQSPLYAINWRG